LISNLLIFYSPGKKRKFETENMAYFPKFWQIFAKNQNFDFQPTILAFCGKFLEKNNHSNRHGHFYPATMAHVRRG
jgi:hypothetical protein